ncbi:MAG: zinc ribbon domain-containing protein [Chloroflexota bacterium]
MFCHKCGVELVEGSRYCFRCGAEVPEIDVSATPQGIIPAVEEAKRYPPIQPEQILLKIDHVCGWEGELEPPKNISGSPQGQLILTNKRLVFVKRRLLDFKDNYKKVEDIDAALSRKGGFAIPLKEITQAEEGSWLISYMKVTGARSGSFVGTGDKDIPVSFPDLAKWLEVINSQRGQV